MPANLMEVPALTQIFARRVINQHSRHARLPGLDAPVREALKRYAAADKEAYAAVLARHGGGLAADAGRENGLA